MKTKILLSLSVATFLSTVGVFANHSEFLGRLFEINSVVQADNSSSNSNLENVQVEQTIEKEIANSENPISDEIAFDMFFIEVIFLEKAAGRAEAEGKSGNLWRNHLRRYGFTEDEASLIQRVSKEYAAEVAPLHVRAVQIIKNARGALTEGQQLPPPPPELATLQQKRVEITLHNRNKLQGLLGTEAFQKVRQMTQSGAKTIQIDPANLMDREERLNQFRQRITTEVQSND